MKTNPSWLCALRLIPATWGWHPINFLFVTLTPGVLLIALNWAFGNYEFPTLEANAKYTHPDAIVLFFSLSLIMLGVSVCLVIDDSSEAKFFRNLPIPRFGSILISSLNIYSMSLASMLILMIGLFVVGAPDRLYLILTLAYLIHLTAGGATISIVSLFLLYMRAWNSESKAPVFMIVSFGWLMGVVFYFAKGLNEFVNENLIQETPWESFLLPLFGCALLSWMTVYGTILLPVITQRPRNNQFVHRVKPNLFQKDMLRREPPGGMSFLFLLRSWGGGFLPTISLIVFICHLRIIDLVSLYEVIEPYMSIAGYYVLVIDGVLLTIPIALILMRSVSRVIFFIPLWHTFPIPDRWVPNFFAVGIYTLTIIMGIYWMVSDQPIENLLAVGMIPLGLQMLCAVSFTLNPSVWGCRRKNSEGFIEGMIIYSLFSFLILVLMLGSFSLILLAIPLACVGTIYSYWAMHWMWKRY